MAPFQENKAETTKRIAKNTAYLYGRMIVTILISLFSTRLLLSSLGEVDYGIFNAVGGFVVLFSLVSGTLSYSVSRFLTFALGQNDEDRLKRVFSTSLIIHLFLALILLILLETIGLWFVENKMTIPADRIEASKWVYQWSIISFLIGIISVPYQAAIMAHEHMTIFAILGILQVILHFLAVLYLTYSPNIFDRLIIYSILNVLIGAALQIYNWYYCRKHFSESHFKWIIDKRLIKDMGTFAGWNLIGSSASMLKDHGVNVLINVFHGPAINAARGIGGSINGAVTKFSGSFMTAIRPQIIKSYAAGDFPFLFSLVHRGSKFAYFGILIFALPMFIEVETVLGIWLGDYPIKAPIFARLFIIVTLLEVLSDTLITLLNATGRIKNANLVTGTTLLLNFPLSYLALKNGLPAEATLIVAFIVGIACLILRLLFLKHLTGLSFTSFMKNVVLNIFIVTICSALLPTITYLLLININPIVRMVIIGIISLTCTTLSILYIGCTISERKFLISKTQNFINKRKRNIQSHNE